jgi:hypothetical protein
MLLIGSAKIGDRGLLQCKPTIVHEIPGRHDSSFPPSNSYAVAGEESTDMLSKRDAEDNNYDLEALFSAGSISVLLEQTWGDLGDAFQGGRTHPHALQVDTDYRFTIGNKATGWNI